MDRSATDLANARMLGSPDDVEAVRENAGTVRPTGVWHAIGLLLVIGIFNYLDRVLPAILAQDIKRDLALSDAMLGVINGVGFLALYAVASIPLAKLSDSGRQNLVISTTLGVWSLMTVAGSFAGSGLQLTLTRAGVALGEAGGMPAAMTFIARAIPVRFQARALSLYTACLPLGTMAGFIVGGILGQALGWRMTFLVLGLVGLGLASLSAFVLGVNRKRGGGNSWAVVPASAGESGLRSLLRKASVWSILVGGALIGAGGYTAVGFSPAFLMRSHGMALEHAGVAFGLVGGVTGVIGLVIVGTLADWLAARDVRWLPGVVICASLAVLPFTVAACRVASPTAALICLGISGALAMVHAAPLLAALHRLAPDNLRAQASALLLLSSAIIGGLGPLVTGLISDALHSRFGADALGWSMLTMPACYATAALCLVPALLRLKCELAQDT